MTVLAICRAVYPYTPQDADEVELAANEICYVLDQSDPDWWKVRLRSSDSSKTPAEGLVPANYLEEVSKVAPLEVMSPLHTPLFLSLTNHTHSLLPP